MSVKAYALTTRQRLIDYLGLNSADLTAIQQSILDRIIDSATEYLQKKVGFKIKKTTYTQELYDGDAGRYLHLKAKPVISTETFKLEVRNSDKNEDDWDEIDSEDYVVDYNAGIIKGMSGYIFRKGFASYRVTYTAGYDFDNAATFLSDTEGGDLELAMWILCQDAWEAAMSDTKGVKSERIGDYAVTYEETANEDERFIEIIEKYSSLDLAGLLSVA